ncbi:hypothetical protein N1207_11000 [Bacillus subtilis]|uniref:hypothetical protein n=1 Tax=Bacillus subtilis TaxID=1423 RepID=UPI0013F5AC7D|nr:hypothetical protein [Bacillus subtilis]MCS4324026.1 hypothetical protein [Bacillus subtilis]NQE96801.1 hypothetical protein [Bacillus subtilis]UWS55260.1 hypothetical protein N1207_11000 [Bacillus subtilis]WBU32449.1 hypothetical protein OSK17_10910 [Bacillus subtilis]
MDNQNLWPEFSASSTKSAKEILEKQAEFLPEQTNNLLYAEIPAIDMDNFTRYDYDLGYQFLIRSKLMDRYRFEMFSIYHNIVLYPVFVRLDRDIKTELDYEGSIHIHSEEEFVEFLRKVFSSSKVKNVIGSLMKLSN